MDLVRNYPVEVSILFGNIEILSGVPFGTLTIDMKGEGKDILDAVAYLKSREIKVEELGGQKLAGQKFDGEHPLRGEESVSRQSPDNALKPEEEDKERKEDRIWNG